MKIRFVLVLKMSGFYMFAKSTKELKRFSRCMHMFQFNLHYFLKWEVGGNCCFSREYLGMYVVCLSGDCVLKYRVLMWLTFLFICSSLPPLQTVPPVPVTSRANEFRRVLPWQSWVVLQHITWNKRCGSHGKGKGLLQWASSVLHGLF